MNKAHRWWPQYIAVIFLVLGLMSGIGAANSFGAVDPNDVKMSIEYPETFPASELVKHPNIPVGVIVFSLFGFFATVTLGINMLNDTILNAKDELLKERTRNTAPEDLDEG